MFDAVALGMMMDQWQKFALRSGGRDAKNDEMPNIASSLSPWRIENSFRRHMIG
jgi:hypothetical protein